MRALCADTAPAGGHAAQLDRSRVPALAGILNAQRDALDGGLQGLEQGVVLASAIAPAVQQVDLQQVQRVDIRIAQANVALQHLLVIEQAIERLHFENAPRGQGEFILDVVEEALVFRTGQPGVTNADTEL